MQIINLRFFAAILFINGIRMIASLRKMMASPGLRKWLTYAQPLILAVVTFVVASRFAQIGVDAHHDGIMFKPASMWLRVKCSSGILLPNMGRLRRYCKRWRLKCSPLSSGHQTANRIFLCANCLFLWLI